MQSNILLYNRISIHAPARGATKLIGSMTIHLMQFQSTLPQGERLNQQRVDCIRQYFNPRSRKGSDTGYKAGQIRMAISIHAPARGATPAFFFQFVTFRDFNPRSRKGSDIFLFPFVATSEDFNPRSRKGSDYILRGIFVRAEISIHAPARGATT